MILCFSSKVSVCRSSLHLKNDSTEAKLAVNAQEGGALRVGENTRPHSPLASWRLVEGNRFSRGNGSLNALPRKIPLRKTGILGVE